MSFKFQHAGSRRNRAPVVLTTPIWARWLVLSLALVLSAVTTGQAAHIHRPGTATHQLQTAATGSQSADSEEHCALCAAALHQQALPAAMHVVSSPELLDEAVPTEVAERTAATAWHFARFGRPPPSLV